MSQEQTLIKATIGRVIACRKDLDSIEEVLESLLGERCACLGCSSCVAETIYKPQIAVMEKRWLALQAEHVALRERIASIRRMVQASIEYGDKHAARAWREALEEVDIKLGRLAQGKEPLA